MRCAALMVCCAAAVLGQDPYTTAPNNYKLEFENDWVRVSRVTYRPGDKLPVHDHPAYATVYVYTTDGGPVYFGHQGFEALSRPAAKAWQIRFSPGNKETHTTEYLGDKPSEYLRIELKTERADIPHRSVRIAAGDSKPFENAQVRIERLDCSPCVAAAHPAVVISTSTGRSTGSPASLRRES